MSKCYRDCEWCEGSGREQITYQESGTGEVLDRWVDCKSCQGLGFVENENE